MTNPWRKRVEIGDAVEMFALFWYYCRMAVTGHTNKAFDSAQIETLNEKFHKRAARRWVPKANTAGVSPIVNRLAALLWNVYMNKFQLQCLLDEDLKRLRKDALDVLRHRRERRLALRSSKRKAENAESLVTEFAGLLEQNSSSLLSLPSKFKNPSTCAHLLPSLLAQDWSSVYPEDQGPEKFYVYAHVDPTKAGFGTVAKWGGAYGGRPFYIGKGTGRRAYDLKRNQGHGRILYGLLNNGFGPDEIVKIIQTDLKESKALELEAKFIYFFGTVYDGGLGIAGRKKWLVNLDVPTVPKFEGQMMTKRAWDLARAEFLKNNEEDIEAAP